MIGSGGREAAAAMPKDCKDWWEFVLKAGKLARDACGEQRRPVTILSLCCGMLAEEAALKRLGIDFRVVASCDVNDSVAQFIANRRLWQGNV